MTSAFSVSEWARPQFPALLRRRDGRPVVHFDGPAGSQVPLRVADAVRAYLLESNANTHGDFATSVETDHMVDELRKALATFVGASSPDEVALGPNMTTLTLGLSRALLSTFARGDEIIVTCLDHDANVTPWVRAAADHGVVVRKVAVNTADATLDMDNLVGLLNPRTRLVAVTAGSNLVGSLTPIAEICQRAHAVGAEVFVDAVHFAPHRRIDVEAIGCDYLAASVYKFFGPHVGLLWGRSDRLASLPVYQVRPALGDGPERWSTGTQSLEGFAGARAAIDYLADLGAAAKGVAADAAALGTHLDSAFEAITAHENALTRQLLAGMGSLPQLQLIGIGDGALVDARLPTIALRHATVTPQALSAQLAAAGIYSWAGNSYACGLTEALGLEPDGVLRIGLLHYNTADEVATLLEALAAA